MTIALKIGNEYSKVQGFVYLDAVTSYTRNLSGKVTSFPVDSGANIADHFIAETPKFTIEGVISDVDITGISDKIKVGDEKPLNAKSQPNAAQIVGQEAALKYLPSAVLQFFERTDASVSVDSASQTNIPAVEMLFEELMRGSYYNQTNGRWYNKMTPAVIYEMNGSNFVNAHTDIVIKDVQFKEDPDGGDALYLSLSAEKVRFVTVDQTDMPKLARTNVQKKVAGTEKKGNPETASGTGDTEANKDGYSLSNKNNNPLSEDFQAPRKVQASSFQTENDKLNAMK